MLETTRDTVAALYDLGRTIQRDVSSLTDLAAPQTSTAWSDAQSTVKRSVTELERAAQLFHDLVHQLKESQSWRAPEPAAAEDRSAIAKGSPDLAEELQQLERLLEQTRSLGATAD